MKGRGWIPLLAVLFALVMPSAQADELALNGRNFSACAHLAGGKMITGENQSGVLSLWDLNRSRNGSPVKTDTLRTDFSNIDGLEASSDGSYFAATGEVTRRGRRISAVVIYNQAGREQGRIEGEDANTESWVVFSPISTEVAVLMGRTLAILTIGQRNSEVLSRNITGMDEMRFSPRGDILSILGNGRVTVFTATRGRN